MGVVSAEKVAPQGGRPRVGKESNMKKMGL